MCALHDDCCVINKLFNVIEIAVVSYEPEDEIKEKKMITLVNEVIPFYLEKLETIVKDNNGHFALGKVSSNSSSFSLFRSLICDIPNSYIWPWDYRFPIVLILLVCRKKTSPISADQTIFSILAYMGRHLLCGHFRLFELHVQEGSYWKLPWFEGPRRISLCNWCN